MCGRSVSLESCPRLAESAHAASTEDFEEVVRLVSYATNEPIGAINVSRESGHLQADVITSTTVSAHTFVVEKRRFAWYIVSKSEPEIE